LIWFLKKGGLMHTLTSTWLMPVLLGCAVMVPVEANTAVPDNPEVAEDSTVEDIPGLVHIVKTSGYYTSRAEWAAESDLVQVGRPAVPAVSKLLDERGWIPRYKAIKILARIGPDAAAALPALEKQVQQEKQHFLVGKYAPLAIAALRSDPQFLIEFVTLKGNRKNPPHTTFAVELLGRMGPKAKKAIPVLGELSIHGPSNGRSTCVQALEQIDPVAARRVKLQTGRAFQDVACAGMYRQHLQGVCTNDKASIYWSFTSMLVKTDVDGNVLTKLEVKSHHGDLCHHDEKIYVAVNFGKFNDPQGNADSWVYVYRAGDLALVAKHATPQVLHGAGGIGYRKGHFFVVGGLPEAIQENYVYEYDGDFKFVKKHVVDSGHTRLGIQTATFHYGRWLFGCYGDPKILLVTDKDFQMLGRFEFDCSLGIVGLPTNELLSANGHTDKDTRCVGSVRRAVFDSKAGLRFVKPPEPQPKESKSGESKP
jgi:hypothetical protein